MNINVKPRRPNLLLTAHAQQPQPPYYLKQHLRNAYNATTMCPNTNTNTNTNTTANTNTTNRNINGRTKGGNSTPALHDDNSSVKAPVQAAYANGVVKPVRQQQQHQFNFTGMQQQQQLQQQQQNHYNQSLAAKECDCQRQRCMPALSCRRQRQHEANKFIMQRLLSMYEVIPPSTSSSSSSSSSSPPPPSPLTTATAAKRPQQRSATATSSLCAPRHTQQQQQQQPNHVKPMTTTATKAKSTITPRTPAIEARWRARGGGTEAAMGAFPIGGNTAVPPDRGNRKTEVMALSLPVACGPLVATTQLLQLQLQRCARVEGKHAPLHIDRDVIFGNARLLVPAKAPCDWHDSRIDWLHALELQGDDDDAAAAPAIRHRCEWSVGKSGNVTRGEAKCRRRSRDEKVVYICCCLPFTTSLLKWDIL